VINPTSHDPAELAAALAAERQAQIDAIVQEAAEKAAATLAKQQAQAAEITKLVSELNALHDANEAAKTAYDSHLSANGVLTASVGSADGKLTLTSNIAGVELDGTISVSGGISGALARTTTQSSSAAQVDTLTLSGTPAAGSIVKLTVSANQVDRVVLTGVPEAGDKYSVTVNGVKVTYTVTGGEGGLAGVRTALVNAVNASAGPGAAVTAAAGSDSGALTLTAKTSGTAFTSSATAIGGCVGGDAVLADAALCHVRSLRGRPHLAHVEGVAPGHVGQLGDGGVVPRVAHLEAHVARGRLPAGVLVVYFPDSITARFPNPSTSSPLSV